MIIVIIIIIIMKCMVIGDNDNVVDDSEVPLTIFDISLFD